MIVSQKRNCNNCRALEESQLGAIRCGLGYNIKVKLYHGAAYGAIPLQPCPKPTILDDYWRARDDFRAQSQASNKLE